MTRKQLILAMLLIPLPLMAAQKSASYYKTHKLSDNTVVINCIDGRKPIVSDTVARTNFVVITCENSK